MGRAPGGRNRAITPTIRRALMQALQAGTPIRVACRFAKIGESTYFAEVKRDPSFAAEAEQARAASAVRALALIQKAAPTDWRAAAKFLELSFPEHFGRIRPDEEQAGKAAVVKLFATLQEGAV